MDTFNKLVRDLIPRIIEEHGKKPLTRILNDEEYQTALKNKVVEEAMELSSASDEELIGEIADIYELLDTIMALKAISPEEVRQFQAQKRDTRGGFSAKILLEKVIME